MGLPIESAERPFYVPSDERTSEIESELRSEFHSLLTNGGIITRSGNILPVQLEEFLPRLPIDIQQKIHRMPVQRLTFKKIGDSISPTLDVEHISHNRIAFLFDRNSIKRLAYKRYHGGGLMPVIIGHDGTHTPSYISGQFPKSFAERTKRVLHHEGYMGSHFRFMSETLKEFADNEGLGNLSGQLAQEAIRIGKENAAKIAQ